MSVVITGSDMVTCLGDADTTFKALIDGVSGATPLRFVDPAKVQLTHSYQIDDGPPETAGRTARWLGGCIAGAVRAAGCDLTGRRVSVIVGTGLRELRAIERWHVDGVPTGLADTHFGTAVRSVLPDAVEVLTLANACAASGYALGLAMDLLESGERDVVVVAGVDATTESMLAMIGRVGAQAPARVRPFDVDRHGVLLGEGAAAAVLERAADVDAGRPVRARLRGVGLTCDAYHETAPDPASVLAAMRDAHRRAGLRPDEIGLVVAHGTGTQLNDPVEAAALLEAFGEAARPHVTGIKGAIGHTSGAAALMGLLVAVEAMRISRIPPIAGLDTPIDEARGLDLVTGRPAATTARIAQVNAFGFGGVNAVAMVEV